ncbi:MAG: hypothetical protein AAFX03_09905, partial [Pseudomonadota bacterium]
MTSRYDPQTAEPKWRSEWEKADLFRAKSPSEAGDAPKAISVPRSADHSATSSPPPWFRLFELSR